MGITCMTAAEPLCPSLVSVILGRSARGTIGMAMLFQTKTRLLQLLFSHKCHTRMSEEDEEHSEFCKIICTNVLPSSDDFQLLGIS